MSENVGPSTSRNPKGLHGLYGDNFTLPKRDMLVSTNGARKLESAVLKIILKGEFF
jgi:hypothetical protein